MKIALIYSVSGNWDALRYLLDILDEEYNIQQTSIYSLGGLIGFCNQNEICLEVSQEFATCLIGTSEEIIINECFDNIREDLKLYFQEIKNKISMEYLNKFHLQPIHLNKKIVLANEQNIEYLIPEMVELKEKLRKMRDLSTPFWEDVFSVEKILIFGGYHLPAIFYKDKSINCINIDKEATIQLDENIKGISIGSVAYSKYFLKGFMNYSILEDNILKLCSRPFKFNKNSYLKSRIW